MVRQLLFVLLVINLYSCKKAEINQPSYIDVSSCLFTSTSVQGTTNQQFDNVEVYANNKPLGIWPVPSKIPIDADGTVEIKMLPVVKINGQSGLKVTYPFVKFYIKNIDLTRGVTTPFIPNFEYYPGTTFKWIEDFENNGTIFSNTISTIYADTSYSIINSGGSPNADVFEGNKTMILGMSASKPRVETSTASSLPFALSSSGTVNEVYIEFNYKADQAFTFGVIGNSSNYREVGGASATDGQWKKMYVFLTEVINTQPTYTNYKIFFHANKDANLSNPRILIDNVKVLSQLP